MKIKVCGLKEPGNINAVAVLEPSFMGFICYTASPRFIGNLEPENLNTISANIYKTGVFVNESLNNIETLISKYNFAAVQLHGSESAEECDLLRRKAIVIKAFGVDGEFDFDSKLAPYVGKVDYFLFDTKTNIHGGSGKTFNWELLNNYNFEVPFFLSGGLRLENLEEIKMINHPQFYGVDLNSKFEDSPGLKNIEKLTTAFDIIKNNTCNELRS